MDDDGQFSDKPQARAPNSQSAPQQSAAQLRFWPNIAKVVADPACIACGHRLTALRMDQCCPGCGVAAGRSLSGNFLRFAAPRYTHQLARGTVLILWGLLIAIVGAIAAGALARLLRVGNWPVSAMMLAGGLVGLRGNWLITAPGGDPIHPAWAWRMRILLRVLIILGLGRSLWALGSTLHILQPIAGDPASGHLTFTGPMLSLLLAAGWVVQCMFFRRLAKRLPDRHLAQYTQIVMWGVMAAVAVMFAAMVLGVPMLVEIFGPRPDVQVPNEALVAPLVCTLVLVFLLIWWAGLLSIYRRHFLDAANLAEKSWCGEGHGELAKARQADVLVRADNKEKKRKSKNGSA